MAHLENRPSRELEEARGQGGIQKVETFVQNQDGLVWIRPLVKR